MKMEMKQVQQQVKEKPWETILTVLVIIVAIGFLAYVGYDNFKLQSESAKKTTKTTLKNPIHRQMDKNKRERDLSRQVGKDLKTIFDYVDR